MRMAGPSQDSPTAPIGLCRRERALQPQTAVSGTADSATVGRRADVTRGPSGTFEQLLLERQLDALVAFGRRRFHPTSRCTPSRFRSTMGMIKSSPNKIIADGTDRHFLNEIRRELKA